MLNRELAIEVFEMVGACLIFAIGTALIFAPLLAAVLGPAELDGAGLVTMMALSVAGPAMFGIGRYLKESDELEKRMQSRQESKRESSEATKISQIAA